MFEAAKKRFDRVIVLLNSDEWLTEKKGRPFMFFNERRYILESIRYIDEVLPVDDKDGTVVAGLRQIRARYPKQYQLWFGNGGDRTVTTTPELAFCSDNGIHLVWNLGGGKVQSSSELVRTAALAAYQPLLFVDEDQEE